MVRPKKPETLLKELGTSQELARKLQIQLDEAIENKGVVPDEVLTKQIKDLQDKLVISDKLIKKQGDLLSKADREKNKKQPKPPAPIEDDFFDDI